MKELVSPSQAFQIISDKFSKHAIESIALHKANGRVLAESILCDRDQPPFHRVMMDGYAFKLEAWEEGIRDFLVEGIQAAGDAPISLKNINGCIEVMTGAVLPNDCSVVIQYEKSDRVGDVVSFRVEEVKHFQNVHARGFDKKQGDVILQSNQNIGPIEVAALASVGKSKVVVFKQLNVAIVATGNELVEVHEVPADHEIRSSNLEMLQALLSPHASSVSLFRMSDDESETAHFIQHELENFDIVCFSGGVSKGKYDFVAKGLEEQGVQKHFHGVKQRPGKPFFFGSKNNTLVFAFPGNPISVLHCATRFLLPQLKKDSIEKVQSLSTYTNNSDLTLYVPAFVSTREDGVRTALLVKQNGSGDFMGAIGANGFVELPPHSTVKENEVLSFYSF